jgi:serine/threonine-protein kinase RsbW
MSDGGPSGFAPPADAHLVLSCAFDLATIAGVRHAILRQAPAFGLVEPFLSDFILAVNEVTSNAVRHGGGNGRLRLWQSLASLICEVDDDGRVTDGTMAPAATTDQRMREHPAPGPTAEGGRGLWLARRLCDTVDVTATAAGTSVVLAFSAHLRSR